MVRPAAEYVPAAQPRQAVEPLAPWYLPAAQLPHAVANAAEYLPRPQLLQLDARVAAWYCPAGHPVQVKAPTSEKRAEAQSKHPLAPVPAA